MKTLWPEEGCKSRVMGIFPRVPGLKLGPGAAGRGAGAQHGISVSDVPFGIISSCVLSDRALNRPKTGEVAEWSNAAVLKTVERESVPRVRIPVSPPLFNDLSCLHWS